MKLAFKDDDLSFPPVLERTETGMTRFNNWSLVPNPMLVNTWQILTYPPHRRRLPWWGSFPYPPRRSSLNQFLFSSHILVQCLRISEFDRNKPNAKKCAKKNDDSQDTSLCFMPCRFFSFLWILAFPSVLDAQHNFSSWSFADRNGSMHFFPKTFFFLLRSNSIIRLDINNCDTEQEDKQYQCHVVSLLTDERRKFIDHIRTPGKEQIDGARRQTAERRKVFSLDKALYRAERQLARRQCKYII